MSAAAAADDDDDDGNGCHYITGGSHDSCRPMHVDRFNFNFFS